MATLAEIEALPNNAALYAPGISGVVKIAYSHDKTDYGTAQGFWVTMPGGEEIKVKAYDYPPVGKGAEVTISAYDDGGKGWKGVTTFKFTSGKMAGKTGLTVKKGGMTIQSNPNPEPAAGDQPALPSQPASQPASQPGGQASGALSHKDWWMQYEVELDFARGYHDEDSNARPAAIAAMIACSRGEKQRPVIREVEQPAIGGQAPPEAGGDDDDDSIPF